MKLFVYSRAAIEAITPHVEAHVVISITTVPEDHAHLRDAAHRIGMLRLVFHDRDTLTPTEHPEDVRLFTALQARQIWQFVVDHRAAAEHLLVHCDAGVSRSPAVAAAISRVLHGDDFEFFNRYRPNMFVYRTLLDVHHAEFSSLLPPPPR